MWAVAFLGGGAASSVPTGERTAASSAPLGVTLEAVPLNGSAPLLVWLHASVSPVQPAEFEWTFGDGGYWNESGVANSTISHAYGASGRYVAAVAVLVGNESARANVTIQVSSVALTVHVTAIPTLGPAPLTVRFAATPSGGTGSYPYFTWSFGDGGVGSGPDLSYTYLRSGNFSANLTVLDTDNHSATWSERIDVTAAPDAPPISAAGAPSSSAWLDILLVGGVLAAAALFGAASWWRTGGRSSGGRSGPEERIGPAPPDEVVPPPSPPSDETLPESAEPGPAAADLPPEVLAHRVLLHLYGLGILSPDGLATTEWTQAGVAERLGLRQSAVSRVLQRLVAGGAVESRLRHVRGRPRRVRVYTLTAGGERLAKDLRLDRSAARRPPR